MLGIDIAASTGYLLLLVLVTGVFTWLHNAPQDVTLAAAVAWVAIAAGAITPIWMIWSGRRF